MGGRGRALRNASVVLALAASLADAGSVAAADPGSGQGHGPPAELDCLDVARGESAQHQGGPHAVDDCLLGGGGAIAADFNHDNISDLAVGAPYEDVGGLVDAGAVYVFYGSPTGFTGQAPDVITQDSPGVEDAAEAGDRFGFSLAAVDLDCSGKADLVVGAPGEDIGTATDAGAVHVVFGRPGASMSGTPLLTGVRNHLTEDTGALLDNAQPGDLFGYALAWGRMTTAGNAFHVAIGAPGEEIGGLARAGAVYVLESDCDSGAPVRGLTDVGAHYFHQNTIGLADTAEAEDMFGTALASALGNGGASVGSWLAIGSPGESGTVSESGALHVLPPGANGPTGSGSQLWTQNTGGVPDAEEAGDRFGSVLAAGQLTPGCSSLVVGIPNENVSAGGTLQLADAGMVQIFPSVAGCTGLTATGSTSWTQASSSGTSPTEAIEKGDGFGAALAVSRLGGPTRLAVGAPFEDLGAAVDAGIVHVFVATVTTDASGTVRQSQTPGEADEAGDQYGRALSVWDFTGNGANDLVVAAPYEDLVVGPSTVADAGALFVYLAASGATRPTSANDLLTEADVAEADGPEPGDAFGFSLY